MPVSRSTDCISSTASCASAHQLRVNTSASQPPCPPGLEQWRSIEIRDNVRQSDGQIDVCGAVLRVEMAGQGPAAVRAHLASPATPAGPEITACVNALPGKDYIPAVPHSRQQSTNHLRGGDMSATLHPSLNESA